MDKALYFLHNLDNKELKWRFDLVGNTVVVGKVTGYVWTSQGIPITICVDDKEIPWTSILYIKLEE